MYQKQKIIIQMNIYSVLSFFFPSNAKIIRTAARMANGRGAFTAFLAVETLQFSAVMTEEDRHGSVQIFTLPNSWEATIETVYGDDVPSDRRI